MAGEIQVSVAPVSIRAGNVLISIFGDTGLNVLAGITPTLIIAPKFGSNFPLRHGIGEVPQIYWRFDNFLNRKNSIAKNLLTRNVTISGSVKKFDYFSISHERKFSTM